MEERALQLMSALNFPTNDRPLVSSEPVFSGKDAVKIGDFQIKPKKTITTDSISVTEVQILDEAGHPTANGNIIESVSANITRKELAKKLVMNTMPLSLLIRKYELYTGEVGDFCIIEKLVDRTTGLFKVDTAVIHFVRGSKAVSLYCHSKGKDVHKIAKALDDVLPK